MENQIAHFDLDTFFVSVERLLDPNLASRPVIVGGSVYGRGVVAGCSYEARAYGIHSAQPIRIAHRLCPSGVFLQGSYVHYGEYSKLVTNLIREIVPLCEKSSVDEFYVDLSSTENLKGNTYLWAQEIRKIVGGETQLPLSFGLAKNKLVAKVATTQAAKKIADRHFNVPVGFERNFLSPLPVRALPGIGEVTEEQITTLGIETLGQLAEVDVNILQRLFGKKGRTISEWSNGIDYSPVIQTREQKSYSRETTFGEDTTDTEVIFAILLSLASQLASDLRAAKMFAGKITLKLRYSDFKTVTKTVSVSYTHSDMAIYQTVHKAFLRLWTRRVRVRLLGIEATDVLEDFEQGLLFPNAERDNRIFPVMDLLRMKYGRGIISYAGGQLA